MPCVHQVKSWPNLFQPTIDGTKTHDIRKVHDRDYKVGDVLHLREFDPNKNAYTGRSAHAEITYITSSNNLCALFQDAMNSDYCVLSIKYLEDYQKITKK